VETNYDSDVGAEWWYQVSLRRNENQDRNVSTPPRQLTSVFFNPRGVMDRSAQLEPLAGGTGIHDPKTARIEDRVRSSGDQRILFLSHAVRQMARPDRMIKTWEVRNVIETGVVIEEYPDDPRGGSCLILGRGIADRPVHVVCSPKADFLAIITAYLPGRNEWSDDFTVRTKR
jgi:hypothetical protein